MANKYLVKSAQELKRHKVKTLLSFKVSPKVISKKLRISTRSILNIKKRRVIQRKKGSGRKNILNSRQKSRILRIIKQNPFIAARDITHRLNLPCTSRTVRNYLVSSGFKWRKPDQKPPLTREMMNDRLQWCYTYRNFSRWNKVVFTDESGFWVHDNDKLGWFKNSYSNPVITDHYKGKLNVWAAISARGKIGIHVFTQSLKADVYIDILRDHLLDQANEIYPKGWLFQQDNHPTHTAYATVDFVEREMNPLEWPGYSSDLSPIENLWPLLKRQVRKRQPNSLEELKMYIYEEWDKLSNRDISALCFSMSDRINLCIASNGDKIKY